MPASHGAPTAVAVVAFDGGDFVVVVHGHTPFCYYGPPMHMPSAIQSIGLPSELHADRVVAGMLREMVEAHVVRMEACKWIVGHMPDGNSRAQAKIAKAIEDRGGPFVLKVFVRPGKRGRYSLDIYSVDGWDAERRDTITADDAIPEKPWLACMHAAITSYGKHRYDEELNVHLLVTHHCLSRLCQRCGARTRGDLYDAVQGLWAAFLREHDAHVGRKGWLRDGYRMRFPVRHDGARKTTALAVLNHYDDERGGIVVATILDDPLARVALPNKQP